MIRRDHASVIKAVLFDFGGVLTTSPFEAMASYEIEHGLPAGFIRSVNATNGDANAWAKLERGEVSIEEFSDLFAEESASLGYEVPGEAVLACFSSGRLRPAMLEASRRCARVLKTGLLTNNFSAASDALPAAAREFGPVLEHFDVVLESSRVGVRKPEVRFYELACEQLAIEPSEAVFLDDLGVNLKPARSMGMATIKVVDPAEAIAELEQVVGLALRDG
ncbi:MAG: Alpha-D-glucose 1-phosphate phosphatase YihX [Acidimicrobiales bacterium]|nr:MAG: HAD family hydrolase [Actinomycetota bacterium]MBV6508953.1 Alpha-D-glucose 1-phosphate phosphatase YihX [Acidimicrobiales bacterium]RIK08605.1 MAG: HAD family hydrolase [Acidobacteriota bacterium]